MDYWWIICLIPLFLAIYIVVTDNNAKKYKRKLRKLKRKYSRSENNMSKIINELVGKRCKIPVYGEIKVLDADDEWIKFEYTDKKGNAAVKILKTDDLDNIDLLDI